MTRPSPIDKNQRLRAFVDLVCEAWKTGTLPEGREGEIQRKGAGLGLSQAQVDMIEADVRRRLGIRETVPIRLQVDMDRPIDHAGGSLFRFKVENHTGDIIPRLQLRVDLSGSDEHFNSAPFRLYSRETRQALIAYRIPKQSGERGFRVFADLQPASGAMQCFQTREQLIFSVAKQNTQMRIRIKSGDSSLVRLERTEGANVDIDAGEGSLVRIIETQTGKYTGTEANPPLSMNDQGDSGRLVELALEPVNVAQGGSGELTGIAPEILIRKNGTPASTAELRMHPKDAQARKIRFAAMPFVLFGRSSEECPDLVDFSLRDGATESRHISRIQYALANLGGHVHIANLSRFVPIEIDGKYHPRGRWTPLSGSVELSVARLVHLHIDAPTVHRTPGRQGNPIGIHRLQQWLDADMRVNAWYEHPERVCHTWLQRCNTGWTKHAPSLVRIQCGDHGNTCILMGYGASYGLTEQGELTADEGTGPVAQIRHTGTGFSLEAVADKPSRINGGLIRPGDDVPLCHGDKIELGETQCVFAVGD